MWDFNKEVTDIKTVPEQFRNVYIAGEGENEGKFFVGEQFAGLTSAIVGLNKSLKASRDEASTAQASLKGWTALGENPEAIQENVDKLNNDLKDAVGKNKSFDPEKLQAQYRTEWEGKVTAANDRISVLQGSLKHSLVNSAALTAIAKHNGVAELLMPHIQSQVKMVEEGGKFGVQVVDPDGDIRYSPTSGGLMTVEELITEMKAHPHMGMAFKSNLKGGDGSQGNGNRRNLHSQDAGNMSATDKISAGLGH